MMRVQWFWRFLVTLLIAIACASPALATSARDDFGVLIMAHGGPPQWNEEVLAALQPLQGEYPCEIAFGMADAATLQESVRKLEARGVRKIGVVRLFVSGDSWAERTEQIFGLRPGAPEPPVSVNSDHSSDAHGAHGHRMSFWKIQTDAAFALTKHGLVEAAAMGEVLADRARALSRNPRQEDVLILAHGPGDDAENARWLADLEARTDALRAQFPFRRIHVETLREDWPEKRKEAEYRIRAFVARARTEKGLAIVIPFRVQGFGPYKQVLEGLDYLADGRGLVPHPNVTAWIEQQIKILRDGPFRSATSKPELAESASSGTESDIGI